jgi:hypothetical protein
MRSRLQALRMRFRKAQSVMIPLMRLFLERRCRRKMCLPAKHVNKGELAKRRGARWPETPYAKSNNLPGVSRDGTRSFLVFLHTADRSRVAEFKRMA